jgi:gliding motility-associated-like protein
MNLSEIRCGLIALAVFGSAYTAYAQYQVNNNATQTSCNCYELTPDAGNMNGSVWNVNQINLNNPFNFNFDVFLGCNDGGADGIAFVLQPLSVNAGSAGGGLGYQGIVPSLAVEIDTYQNATDPAVDHISLQLNGDVNHGGANNLAGPTQASATSGNVEDCAWHLLEVNWDPAIQQLNVLFDGVLRMTWVGNLAAALPSVYWGFTGATGGASNQQQFCNQLNPNFTMSNVGNCPGMPVQFTSTSTTATGNITNIQWDFGDGTNGVGATPTHTYAAAGNYNVTVTITSEGCTQSQTSQVTIVPAPTVNAGPDVSICEGTGVSLNNPNTNVIGTYAWSPAAGLNSTSTATPLATPLVNTTYTLSVTDINGCTGSDQVNVTVNPLPTADAGADQSMCIGTPTQLGGSGGVSYQWNPPAGLSSTNAQAPTANPVANTVYTLTVTDANGCTDADDVTVNVNPLPIANAGLDQTVCAGTAANLVAIGGTQYSWSPSTGLSADNVANPQANPAATVTYVVTVTDANGCTATDNVQVSVNPVPTVNLGPDLNICLGGNIQLNNPNALGSGTYSWNPVTALTNPAAPSPTASPGATTTYTLTFTTNQNCTATDQVTVNVNPPPAVDAGPDQVVCINAPMNMAGSGAVNYSWSPITDLTDAIDPVTAVTPTTTTTYTLTGTDAFGCVNTDQVTITVNPLPAVNAGPDLTVCQNGQAILSALGTGSFQWSPAAGLNSDVVQAPLATASVTTVYTVTLTDVNGCQNSDDMTLTVAPLPTAVIDPITDVCEGSPTSYTHSSTGNIIGQLWDFGDGITSLLAAPTHTYGSANTYNVTLTVTTADGCIDNETQSAVVVAVPTAIINVVNGPDFCEGETIQFQNGTLGQLTSILWNFRENALIPGLPNTTSTLPDPTFAYQYFGTYNPILLVTAGNGCSDQTTITLNIHDNPVADYDFTIACEGQQTSFTDQTTVLGTYTISAWDWDFGDGSAIDNTQNPQHQFPTDGLYEVELTAYTDMGCGDSFIDTVWVNNTPSVSISATEVCVGDTTVLTNGTVPQDATIVSWVWDLGDGNTITPLDSMWVYPMDAVFDVSLTATSDSGCVATGTTQAVVHPYPVPLFTVDNAEGCTPHAVLFDDLTTIATGSIASYDWDFGGGLVANGDIVSHVYTDSGFYDVSLTVASDFGCTSTLTLNNMIRVNITPEAEFEPNPNVGITMLDPRVHFLDQSQHATTWSWDFGDGANGTQQNPVHTYQDSGTYTITLRAMNGACWDEDEETIRVDPESFVYIPTAFTPNGNGLNDVLKPSLLGLRWSVFSIYDRWGREMFYTVDPNSGWDGYAGGEEAPIGTYTYMLIYMDPNGIERTVYGKFHLIR